MKKDIKRRLAQIELFVPADWVAKLDIVDYIGITDYEDSSWEEIFFDQTITVLQNKMTGEVRGIYNDRRTDDELKAAGGDLAYL